MSEPKRIQRKRTKGFKMPEGAVYVGRPSIYANPYRIEKKPNGVLVCRNPNGVRFLSCPTSSPRDLALAHHVVTAGFETFLKMDTLDPSQWSNEAINAHVRLKAALDRGDLRGKDLACWCAPNIECHVDVWLRVGKEAAA